MWANINNINEDEACAVDTAIDSFEMEPEAAKKDIIEENREGICSNAGASHKKKRYSNH